MQPIIITSFFSYYGEPKTDLTPTLRIRKSSDSTLVITDAIMTHVGEGQYKYSFSEGEPNNTYTVVCDGGSGLPNLERYTYASIDVPAVELVADFSE